MESPDRLYAFLYLLMRDHVPTGTVAEIIRQLPDDDEPMVYTAPELHALAYRYGQNILPPEAEPDPGESWLEHAPMRILEELSREKMGVGNGLTIAELADAAGWDAGDDDDIREASGYVQRAYDAGYVQRDLANADDPKILITDDGELALNAWRTGAPA